MTTTYTITVEDESGHSAPVGQCDPTDVPDMVRDDMVARTQLTVWDVDTICPSQYLLWGQVNRRGWVTWEHIGTIPADAVDELAAKSA